MKKHLLIAGLAGITLFAACKKNNEDPTPTPSKTKKELIQQRWKVAKQMVINYDGTSMYDTTSMDGSTGDFVDFRTDGKVVSSFSGSVDTVDYQIINDDSLVIDDGGFKITLVNETNFNFYNKEVDQDGSYEQISIELVK